MFILSNILYNVAKSICNNLDLEFISGSGEGAFKQTFHVMNKEGCERQVKMNTFR